MARYVYQCWFHAWISILCFIVVYTDGSRSPHRDLRDHLLDNYGDAKIRPVHRVSTPTNVTYRPLFVNLVNMDIKNQQFSVTSAVKMVWRDEFLTWHPSDFDDIRVIFLDPHNVWVPDITLANSPQFPVIQPNSKIEVYSDGTVYWFYQANFHSHCAVNVKWFPFDTQVCIMEFLSWIYNGKELEVSHENSKDANQTRYLMNGVWDLVDVGVKKYSSYYACCEHPFYTLEYRLTLRRQPRFYLTYIIVPVILLFALSVSVFLLPADMSVKLQFSITNLLAVALFEKLVAEIVPPSSNNSPVLDTYFEIIIISVSLSVLATVLVMNISNRSREKPPEWFQHFITVNLSQLVYIGRSHHPKKEDDAYQYPTLSSKLGGFYDNIFMDGHHHHDPSLKTPHFLRSDMKGQDGKIKKKPDYGEEWRHIGHVLTRFFAVLFGANYVVSTVSILSFIWFSSEWEFDEINSSFKDEWARTTDSRFI